MDSNKSSPLVVGFVGASHLAYVSAVAAAEKGNGYFKVVCFAKDHTIENIQEPDLVDLLQKNHAHIKFTNSLDDLRACNLIYLAIDVPTDDLGISDVSIIFDTFNEIKDYINQNAYLIILSQVSPGFTRSLDFDKNRLFYQVETLIFGKAVERALYPERYMIGACDKDIPLPKVFDQYLSCYGCPKFIMAYESAELAKISINMYLTATVTTTNMLSEICEKVGANWDDIAQTLKLDKRIGPFAYLKPGLGLAGGNLERDIASIKNISKYSGAFTKMLDSQTEDSHFRSSWPLRKFKEIVKDSTTKIGVLGVAYKENTHSIKNSASVKFINSIQSAYSVITYDPVVKYVEGLESVIIQQTGQDVIDKSNFLAILTPWPEFCDFDYRNFQGTILDPYDIVKNQPLKATICRLGKN